VTLAAAAADTPTLLVELGVVLLLLAVGGRVASRLGVPPVPLYLLAGLGLGEGGVVELITAREFIEPGAQIGVILLLLMLGLEYSGAELVAGLRSNRPAGVVDLTLNAAPGVLAGYLLGWDTTAALFLGGITYISSSGIVAKLLHDLGRIGNRETPTILSILIFEDLVMAVFLPVAAGLAVATGPTETLRDIAVAVAAVAAAFAVTLRFGDRLSRLVFNPSNELLVLTILGAALLIAGSAERIKAPAAVAALLVGIALSGPAATNARVVLTPLRDVFAAVFFVFFALEVDPASIPPALPRAGILALVTATTKLLTGVWAARRAGVALPGRIRAGMTLVPRGEFSIIIAGLALTEGLEPELAPLATAYVLILASAGPVLARFADPIAHVVAARRVRPTGSAA
jgi:monovalent cation:H+ antiporter-2, CPA2 family